MRTTIRGSAAIGGIGLTTIGLFGLFCESAASLMPESLTGFGAMVAVLIGLCILLGRKGAVVNRRDNVVTLWWGILSIPLHQTSRPLSCSSVHVGKQVDLWDDLLRTCYPITLTSPSRRLVLAAGHKVHPTSEIARALAGFLNVRFEDETC